LRAYLPSTSSLVLYLYPIKQGLKLIHDLKKRIAPDVLYLYPIKQGLKHGNSIAPRNIADVLYLYPIKQGLKLAKTGAMRKDLQCSLSLSNKTRIETFYVSIFHFFV